MINTAIKAAKAAGKILMENYGKANKIEVKSDNSLVTQVDIACEQKIKEIILSKYENHSIIGEEGGYDKKNSDYKWIIDPLDGTHNYIYQFPLFGVSIALAHKDDLVIGVIYFPLLNELYTAEKGKGFFLNGKKIVVNDAPLKKSLVCLSKGHFERDSEEIYETAQKIYQNSFNVRFSGCATFDIVSVLRNTFGVWVNTHVKDWDVAAGIVMAREAGGIVTDYEGKKWKFGEESIIVGNKTCHKEFLELRK